MDIKFEGTAFNLKYWSNFSEKDFIAENIRNGVYKSFSDKDRRLMLKEVHKRILHVTNPSQSAAKPKRL